MNNATTIEQQQPPAVASSDGLGVNRVGNTILCYAWGETDRPDVCIARTAAEVRRFLITEAFGNDKDPMLAEWMKELAEWDWRDDGKLEWEFEIGGVRLEDVVDVRGESVRRALLKFVAVEQRFGHAGQHKAAECADCARVLEAMDALEWRDETPNAPRELPPTGDSRHPKTL